MRKKLIIPFVILLIILSFSLIIQAEVIPEGHVRIHYVRPDHEFAGWGLHVWGEGYDGDKVDWAKPLKYDGIDDYSVYWDIPYESGTGDLNFIIHKGGKKDPDPDRSWPNPDENREIWSVTGQEKVYLSLDEALKAVEMENLNIPERPDGHVRLHYHRYDKNYDGWGLHLWGKGYNGESIGWGSPLKPDGKDTFGVFWDIPYKEGAGDLNFIIHKGDKKDIGNDRKYPDPDKNKGIWTVTGNPTEFTSRLAAEKVMSNDIVSAKITGKKTVEVTFKAPVNKKILVKEDPKYLWIDEVDKSQAPKYIVKLKKNINYNKKHSVLCGDMKTKASLAPAVIDGEFAYDGLLGALYSEDETTFKLWAPTASNVELLLFDQGKDTEPSRRAEMERVSNGVWSLNVEGDLKGKFYQYRVVNGEKAHRVLDPYARSMAGFNSFSEKDKIGKAAVVDLDQTDPTGWEKDSYVKVKDQEDVVIYEMSVRDFTIDPDAKVSKEKRGTYKGFIEKIPYLKELGVTHVQLMPVQNFYFGNEFNRSFEEKGSKGEANYNWGYDPHNYFTPEGWYSLNPAKPHLRVKELKILIKELHEAGIGVILDVVYNHTAITDILGDIVPNYYYRLNDDGGYTSGSGCGNDTASRRHMVRKLIVDSTSYWVDEYHVDGFRFDLMGLHDETTMHKIANRVREINPDIVLHGEGWNVGTLPDEEKYVKYAGNNHSLTEFKHAVGAFNDGMRDAMKQEYYASPLNEGGFIQHQSNKEAMLRTGTIAGMIDFSTDVAISEDPYHRYADDPEETTMYASCHDGYALWDKIVGSTPDVTLEERKRMDKLAAAMVFTSQGRSFIHGGSEMLRSKPDPDREHRVDHNSYDSGDSTNMIDWSRTDKYSDMVDYYQGLIKLKLNHEAFRMETMQEIEKGITFIKEDIPYLLGFRLNEQDGDEEWNEIVVLYNSNKEAKTVEVVGVDSSWKVVVDGENAGTKPLNNTAVKLEEDKITIPAISAVVIYR